MTTLRATLIFLFTAVALNTAVVMSLHGMNFLSPFLEALFAMTWQGQFNLDFACYLILSALWVAWRSGFSGVGIGTALIASVFGILFFAPLVLVYAARSDGDIRRLLLGVHATGASPRLA